MRLGHPMVGRHGRGAALQRHIPTRYISHQREWRLSDGVLSTLFNVDWRDRYGSNLTALVLTGVLGGYTTFSSYQLDAANLYNSKTRGLSVYWIGSVAAALVAAALGAITARLFG